MVKKILTYLSKEFHGVNEAALLLGSFAFVSQILGLVRDKLLAHIVGAGTALDVYYAAFRIPDFLYVSMASLASITVILPFVVGKMSKDDDNKKAKIFLNNIFSAFMLCMVFVSIIVYILLPYITNLIAPGFSEGAHDMLIKTSRIMLLSPIFIGISNLLGTITQIYKKFFVFSLSPVFYNVGIILGIIFLYPNFGTLGLACGVVIGALLHLIIQIPTITNKGFSPKFTFSINWKEILTVVKVSLPRTLTLSFNSIAFIALISMASKLMPGSISLFTFSYNLQSVPVGIIGISYSVALFPMMVQSFTKKDTNAFKSYVIKGMQQIIFWSLPVTALFAVLRAQIVRVILGSSTFTWDQTRLTAAALALFVISLVSQGIVLLIVRAYYATGNTKKPLYANLFSSIMVVVFGYVMLQSMYSSVYFKNILETILRVSDVHGTEMLALPFAYALGSIINVFLISLMFYKDNFKGVKTGIMKTILQTLTSTLVLGGVAYFFLGVFDDVFNINTFWGIFLQGLCSGIFGIIAGILILHILKNKEYQEIVKALSKKLWSRSVTVPEQTDL